jgi:dolichyl-phosphate-mannose-protein mannosyltransferase
VLNVSSTSTIVPLDWTLPEPVYLKEGDQIRLEHVSSKKRVHSHDVRPPISEVDFQNEVSGYGFEGFEGDACVLFFLSSFSRRLPLLRPDASPFRISSLPSNDIFVVELSHSPSRRARQHVLTLRSHIRFRHLLTGCYLFSHKIKLPDWGFEQQEVTCNKNPTLDNSLWYIETNTHPLCAFPLQKLARRSWADPASLVHGRAVPPTAEKVNYIKPSFLSKFLELQAVMWQTNAGLTDRHAYDSRPSAWPLMRRGIVRCSHVCSVALGLTLPVYPRTTQNFWVKDHRQIYLIGNPVVWWSSTLAVCAYVAVRLLMFVRAKRGYRDAHHRGFPPSQLLVLARHDADQLFDSPRDDLRRQPRLPLHGLGSPLFPFLPDAAPAVPSSLPAGSLLLGPAPHGRL